MADAWLALPYRIASEALLAHQAEVVLQRRDPARTPHNGGKAKASESTSKNDDEQMRLMGVVAASRLLPSLPTTLAPSFV